MSYSPITIYKSTNLTLSSGSASAQPVSTASRAIRVVGTVDAWISLNGPAAVGQGLFLPTGHVEYLNAAPGTVLAAVPDNGAVGTINISEIG